MKSFSWMLAWATVLAPVTSAARSLEWSALAEAGAVKSGTVAGESIRIENDTGTPRRIGVLVLDAPGVESLRWSLHGRVRYEGVEGDAYLEMNNVLPTGTFFSRTVEAAGPMRKLTGTSDWRPFLLPFDATGGAPPKRLELNVFLPGNGAVEIGPLELVDGAFSAPSGAWFSEQTAGAIYGFLGALFGCLAGLLGVLAGRGAGRGVVMGLLGLLLAGCTVEVVLGAFAHFAGQPWWVTYPAIAGGTLGALILVLLRRVIVKKYRDLELRRMQAMDA